MEKIKLRDYQIDAINAFERNNSIGLLEMATGTGKTITALACIDRHFQREEKQFVVIIVPYLHLIEQWISDFNLIDVKNYITIAGNKNDWYLKLKTNIWEYNKGFKKRVVTIGSYKSMASQDFQRMLSEVTTQTFLVADECHNLGSKSFKKSYFGQMETRLGLSATPRRWWDEKGTERIFKIFDKTIFEYDMEEAISNNHLTPYSYFPQLISLNEEEIGEYLELSKKIGFLMQAILNNKADKKDLDKLLRRRAQVIQKAENKIPRLLELLKQQSDKRYTLVYCSSGEIDNIVRVISDMGIRVHRFNSEVKMIDRKKILKSFANGEIEVLVAIKCLDEGVDVPATRVAYFLSSTSNPREFVQRRGRVLRKHEGKNYSVIYDFIVLQNNLPYNIFEGIARREMSRFAEFSDLSRNKYQERSGVRNILRGYNLEHYMDIKPWEMYEILRKEREEIENASRGY